MKGAILFKSKQLKILLNLRDTSQSWYISTLAKASSATYVHTCNFLSRCEGMGIIASERHGKIKEIRLTEKGVRLVDLLASANSMIMVQEQPKQQEPAK